MASPLEGELSPRTAGPLHMNALSEELMKLNQAAEVLKSPPPSMIPPGLGTTWKAKASLPVAVEYPNCTLWNGDLVVAGHAARNSTAILLQYNAATDSWTELDTEDWIRIDAVFTYGDDLYIMAQTDITTPGEIFKHTEKTDAEGTDTWAHVTTLPSPHGLGTAVCIGSQVIVSGGVSGDRHSWSDGKNSSTMPLYNIAVDVYSFTTGQWSCLPNLKTRRCFHHSLALDTDIVLIYGGTCPGGTSESCLVEQLDINNPENWSPVVSVPYPAACLAVSMSLLFSCGGYEDRGGKMDASGQFSIWSTIDPDQAPFNKWITLPELEEPRAHTAVCFCSMKTVMSVGGIAASSTDDADVWSTSVEQLVIP